MSRSEQPVAPRQRGFGLTTRRRAQQRALASTAPTMKAVHIGPYECTHVRTRTRTGVRSPARSGVGVRGRAVPARLGAALPVRPGDCPARPTAGPPRPPDRGPAANPPAPPRPPRPSRPDRLAPPAPSRDGFECVERPGWSTFSPPVFVFAILVPVVSGSANRTKNTTVAFGVGSKL